MWGGLILCILGFVMLFVVNPGRRSAKYYSVMFLISAVAMAPMIYPILYFAAKDDPNKQPWYILPLQSLAFGPLIIIGFAGVGTIGLVIQKILFRAVPWLNPERHDTP